ncbi:MAG TPA: dihydroorotase [Gammaproteobacteria bacterium]|nr:dihydroorotase [Gammaproteobacteria bacterium]
MKCLAVCGGRVIDPATATDHITDLFIHGDKIIAHGEKPSGFSIDETIDARNTVVCPGLVDLSARLGEPGTEQKGTIASEARAAALGGITTLCCLPDTDPVIDEPATVEFIKRRARDANQARVLPLGALTRGLQGEQLSEMSALYQEGCPAMTQANGAIRDTRVLLRAMQYAASLDIPIILRPQDPWLAGKGCMHEGAIATQLGLPGVPAIAETVAIGQIMALARQARVRVHFSKISSRFSLSLIEQAKSEGLRVTADVSINQLYLTEDDLLGFNSQCHVVPPLRSRHDREVLRQALASGLLDVICSDHWPHETDAKLAPFPSTEPGISGFDTYFSLLYGLVEQGVIDWAQLIRLASARPADILNIEAGSLAIGQPADISIFDPTVEWQVSPEAMFSSGVNTPFSGRKLRGRVRCTLINGQVRQAN